MKAIVSILTFLIYSTIFCQNSAKRISSINLASTSWQSNISCFEDESMVGYELYSYDRNTDVLLWGYFIDFTDSTFTTHYSAPCGNDCFTRVNGTYKFVAKDQIEVYVEQINKGGFCQEKSSSPNKSYGVFQLSKTDKGLKVNKL